MSGNDEAWSAFQALLGNEPLERVAEHLTTASQNGCRVDPLVLTELIRVFAGKGETRMRAELKPARRGRKSRNSPESVSGLLALRISDLRKIVQVERDCEAGMSQAEAVASLPAMDQRTYQRTKKLYGLVSPCAAEAAEELRFYEKVAEGVASKR